MKCHEIAKALAIITLTKVTPELDSTRQAGVIRGTSARAGPDLIAAEIEITPEMIEAGNDVYCSVFHALEAGEIPSEAVVEKIFRAMIAAGTVQ